MAERQRFTAITGVSAVATARGTTISDATVVVSGNTIAAVGPPDTIIVPPGATIVHAPGAWLLPGAIDMHVHLREPGMTDRADIGSETLAAVAGGVTSVVDMPNNKPATTSMAELEWKKRRAALTSMANYAFWMGATADNIDSLPQLDYRRVAGVKVFLGSSTGSLLLDDPALVLRLLATVPAGTPVAFHAEDNGVIEAARRRLTHGGEPADLPVETHPLLRPAEACTTATARVLALTRQARAMGGSPRVHLLHISTRAELALLADAPEGVTAETCPQYLLLDSSMYASLGTRMKCNPAVKEPADRLALVEACAPGGLIATIATDHAPHLPAHKQGGALKAASGMPGLQWSLPLMAGLLGPERAAALMSTGPARLLGIADRGAIVPGMKADLTLLEPASPTAQPIADADVLSRCGWTPWAGFRPAFKVASTWVNGTLVYDGKQIISPPAGRPLRFRR